MLQRKKKLITCSTDVGWNQSKAEQSCTDSEQQLPQNKRSAIYNNISRVMYVRIRKLNFMKRMSNKAINFIFGSSGCNFCLQSFLSRKTSVGQAPGFTSGSLVCELLTFHTYFPNASTEMLAPYVLVQCL